MGYPASWFSLFPSAHTILGSPKVIDEALAAHGEELVGESDWSDWVDEWEEMVEVEPSFADHADLEIVPA